MSFTDDLLGGIADLIDDASGPAAWRPDGSAYQSGEIGIYLDPSVLPASGIVITDYDVDNDPSSPTSTVGVQFRFRAPSGSRTLRPLRDLVFDLFQGMSAVTLGGVRILNASRMTATKLGQDTSGQTDWADSYYFVVHRPGQNRY